MVGSANAPFWNDSYSLLTSLPSSEKGVSRLLRRKGMRAIRELMITLTGVADGAAALAVTSQVTASQHLADIGPGGVRAIASVDDVNRVSTTADETHIFAFLTNPTAVATWPTDASLNGSGGDPYGGAGS